MNTMDLPLAVIACTFSNSFSTSAGTSTAVGSSSRRISAPWYSAFTISTRWRWPTDRSPTVAAGSTGRPYRSATSATRSFSSPRFSV